LSERKIRRHIRAIAMMVGGVVIRDIRDYDSYLIFYPRPEHNASRRHTPPSTVVTRAGSPFMGDGAVKCHHGIQELAVIGVGW
jgi:hypothetical protein